MSENPGMGRAEKRIFRMNDELARLDAELAQTRAELDNHRSLADDAARDAAVFDTPFDREDMRETSADVRRFEELVARLENRRHELAAKRDRLLGRLT